MLQKSTLKFLKELDKNNNKLWFEKHRDQFELTKNDFQISMEELIKTVAVFDKSIAGLEAKKTTFRINRDVRFSKNKNPYKNNMGGYLNKDGKKGIGAGYYLHIQPGQSFAGGGIWMPEAAVLAKIRQEIDYNFDEWKKILNTQSFKKAFPTGLNSSESLVRPPKGYDIGNPAMPFLKMKNFIVTKSFTEAEVLGKDFVTIVAKTFKAMNPMITFLNKAIE